MAFSSNDMYTGNLYSKNKPTWDDEGTGWKASVIQKLLQKNDVFPESIIEVGCGAGGILKELSLLNPSIKSLKGYDISPYAIAMANKHTNEKIQFFNTDYINSNDAGGDVLLVIDVIEHIDDYYGFLNKLRDRSSNVVFHIPLDLSSRNILKPHTILLQRQLVGHLHYFTKEIAEWALKDTGFTVIDWLYTKPAIDTEVAQSFKTSLKKTLRNISFAVNKDWSVKMWGGYSMMILAKG